jgi:hypothetical protein
MVYDEELPMCELSRSDKFRDYDSGSQTICLDVAGESTNTGNVLISYDCTGNWNQLFNLQPDGTLAVTQPDLISRLRRPDSALVNVTICLRTEWEDNSESMVLRTAKCPEIGSHVPDDMYFHFLRNDGDIKRTIPLPVGTNPEDHWLFQHGNTKKDNNEDNDESRGPPGTTKQDASPTTETSKLNDGQPHRFENPNLDAGDEVETDLNGNVVEVPEWAPLNNEPQGEEDVKRVTNPVKGVNDPDTPAQEVNSNNNNTNIKELLANRNRHRKSSKPLRKKYR